MLELLGEVFEALKAHHLAEEPFFERLFGNFQAFPGSCDVLKTRQPKFSYMTRLLTQVELSVVDTHRDHLSFGGHICGAIAKTQFGLQGVEVGLELGLLLHAWRLVFTPISTVVFQLLLATGKRVVGLAAVQPGHRTPDPFEKLKLCGQLCNNDIHTFRISKVYDKLSYVAGKALVLFHKAFVLLVDFENFANAVRGRFSLKIYKKYINL